MSSPGPATTGTAGRTARLRLRPEEFEALLAAVQDGTSDLVDPSLVGIRRALEVAAEPDCSLVVRVTTPQDGQTHRLWVSPGLAALLLDGADGMVELVTVAPEFVPAVLARLTRIGPRRVAERCASVVESPVVDDALGEGAPARVKAFGALGQEMSRAWQVESVWSREDGSTGMRSMTAVDGGDGLYAATLGGLQARLEPVSAADAWLVFTTLLPSEDDLSPMTLGPTP